MPALGVTFASLGALGLPAVPRLAELAESLGFDSFWTAEATGAESFATLDAAGAATEALALGTGIIPIQTRTPQLAAMSAATLAARFPGRGVLLGVGVSSPAVVERWHGVELGDRPLARIREYVQLVRACWSGEAVSFDGEFYSADRFRLAVRLESTTTLRIVLAALGPRMLRLAGEIADGVLLNYLPASAVGWAVEQVRSGEARAGRAPGSCRVAAYVHIGVVDREDGLEKARRDLFSYAVVPAYAAGFRRAGFDAEIDEILHHHHERDRAGAIAAVSDAMVDAIDIIGDAGRVRAALDEYRAAGVEHPVVMPLPWGEDRWAVTEATLRAVAPTS